LKADNVFKSKFSSIVDETSVITEFTPKSENDSTDKSTENKTPSVSELKEVEDDDMPF